MKKILSISFICLLLSVFCSTTSAIAKTSDNNIDLELKLIPYYKVLDKLSNEYGVKIYVSEEDKEKFYKGVKNIPPRQFELQQRKEFKDALKYIHESTSSYDSADMNGSFYPTPIPKADKTIPAIPLN